jgi:ArsR family transcriptional regulator
METLASSFRLLGDATRLRLLRLVAKEELTAGELTQIVSGGQSTVSRHLAMLRDAGLVAERKAGRFVFYSLTPEASREGGPWGGLVAKLCGAEDDHGDVARLADVIRARREDDAKSTEGAGKAPFVPGRSWAAWAQALCWLVPPGMRVLDVGCGDGELTLEIARFASEVVGVDANAALVARATALAAKRGVRNAKFVKGDVHALEFADASFDLVVVSQTLHSLENPAKALTDAARVLAPGSRILVLDLLPHSQEWVREKLHHKCLGFTTDELSTLLHGAGFAGVEVERVAARPREPFQVVLAIGLRKVGRPGRRRISR